MGEPGEFDQTAREGWQRDHGDEQQSIERGMMQAERGEVHDLGTFSSEGYAECGEGCGECGMHKPDYVADGCPGCIRKPLDSKPAIDYILKSTRFR